MVFGPFMCQKLMASYHEIASRSCDTYVSEFLCSRSCDRPPPYFVWFLDFVCRILEFSSSPIFVISVDMIYQFLCIGEFVCHWLDFLRWFLEFMLHQFSWFPLISFINICALVNLCVIDFCDWHWYNRQYLWFGERNKEYDIFFDSCVDLVILINLLLIFNYLYISQLGIVIIMCLVISLILYRFIWYL